MVGSRDTAIGGKEINGHFLYLLVSPHRRPARKLGRRKSAICSDDQVGW
ncbi:hypothetical protein GQ55_9G117800 [Panicum hallii var. hallii]|uniref:Uncharacterized protein n=1 Tax=Panicum hallii var. hallii TaxID=1504633 RepID=A0A2T7C289_9POAL|nr:hypothetical protein GQ55_9G117800 [Panicum hallii var. hallii]